MLILLSRNGHKTSTNKETRRQCTESERLQLDSQWTAQRIMSVWIEEVFGRIWRRTQIHRRRNRVERLEQVPRGFWGVWNNHRFVPQGFLWQKNNFQATLHQDIVRVSKFRNLSCDPSHVLRGKLFDGGQYASISVWNLQRFQKLERKVRNFKCRSHDPDHAHFRGNLSCDG